LVLVFLVGASLLANFGVKKCLFTGTIRWRASSYKNKTRLSLVGASLLANFGVKECLCTGSIRQQASPHKFRTPASPL
jgi:hypothetical protein